MTPLEAAARAISYVLPSVWAQFPDNVKEPYLASARAALTAAIEALPEVRLSIQLSIPAGKFDMWGIPPQFKEWLSGALLGETP